MIQANIVAVDQRFDFRTKTIRSYAVFELNGQEVRAEIESIDEVKILVTAGLNGAEGVAPEQTFEEEPPTNVERPEPGASPTPAPDMKPAPEALFTDTRPTIRWREADDSIISPMMKAAMGALDVPPEIPVDALQQLMGDIVDTFTPEDWASVGYQLPQQQAPEPVQQVPSPPKPAPAPQPKPQQVPVGQVSWSDGSPIMPGVARRARTVQADEYGYPIVSNADVDPGEVVGSGDDIDEDGVGSM